MTIKAMFKFGYKALFASAILLTCFVSNSHALYIGAMDKTAAVVKLCIDNDCPILDEHPFKPGRRIVVYETKGKWARVSRYVPREQAGVNYPGFFLPEKVAMWMPITELPASLAEQVLGMSPDDFKKAEELKKKRRKFSYVPRKVAIPTTDPRGPSGIFDAANANTAKPVEQVAIKPKTKAPNPEESIPVVEVEEIAVEDEKGAEARRKREEQIRKEIAKAQEAARLAKTNLKNDGVEEIEVVEVLDVVEEEPAKPKTPAKKSAEPAKDTAAKETKVAAVTPTPKKPAPVAEPEVKIPTKLTRKLRDKRLAKLPSKPGDGLDLKSVIAIRFHALAMLESNECNAIEDGGRSLALQGWVYIRCAGDPFLHQYEVE